MRTFLLLLLSCSMIHAQEAKWWRGNLHTHTLWSDGNDYPEMVAAWYKEHGYHFLGLSDHNIIADHEKWVSLAKNKGGQIAYDKYVAKFGEKWVETRDTAGEKEIRLKMLSEFRVPLEEPGRFLMISSEEITGRAAHINATNIRETVLPYSGGDELKTSEGIVAAMQYVVSAVLEQRTRLGVPMFTHINHPNFKWALTAEELAQLKGEQFFEIYNGHPTVFNGGDQTHAGTDRVWDIVLTLRLRNKGEGPLFGVGTDDAHQYHNEAKKMARPGRGWVMVRAARLSPDEIVAAMEAGDFYASSGVTLKDVQRGKDTLSLEIAAEPGVTYKTEFIGTRRGYSAKSKPILGPDGQPLRVTRQYSSEIGAVLATVEGNTASYELKGDEVYVRARITSSKPKTDPSGEGEVERAWTQPLVGPAAGS